MINFSRLNTVASDYKQALIKKAEEANDAIKRTQSKFEQFGIDEDISITLEDQCEISGIWIQSDLGWISGKICYRIEDHSWAVLLGAPAKTRVAFVKDLQKLVDKVTEHLENKISELELFHEDEEESYMDDETYDRYIHEEPAEGGPSEADIMLSNGWDRG